MSAGSTKSDFHSVAPHGAQYWQLKELMSQVPRKIKTALLMLGAIVSGLFLFLEDWQRDLTTNHARLEDSAANPLLRPMQLSLTTEATAIRVRRWIKAAKLWDLQSESKSDERIVFHLTRTTRFMRFTDDVTVEVIPTEAGVTILAESRSRVGVGDLGQNPRNLLELTSGLSKQTSY